MSANISFGGTQPNGLDPREVDPNGPDWDELLGNGAANARRTYGRLVETTENEARENLPHATSTLRMIQREDVLRSEKIINVEVASMLAGYEDPIKLLLPPVMQAAAVVHVRRKYVVGGIAARVPERAPAPVSMVQEDVRKVRLHRYGGDVDFNLNACLQPTAFKREMDMKVKAQHGALANELNKLGYETLMREGTSIVDAMARSAPGMTMANPEAPTNEVVYDYFVTQVFGALDKYTYPLHNLLAAAKKCTAYDISRAVKSVMILPHATPELMQYTRAENMVYEINGIKGPQGKPVTLEVTNGYKIPASTASVFVHVPPPLHNAGAAAPAAGDNHLERTREIKVRYARKNFNADNKIINHVTRQYVKFENDGTVSAEGNKFQGSLTGAPGGTDGYIVVTYKVRMQSAIIGVAGDDTGNLLMQYPRSTVSSDASTESGRLQLRVYMNAVLKRPENVLILNDVSFNGFEGPAKIEYKLNADRVFDGAIFGKDNNVVVSNNGHFGRLDDMRGCARLHGMQIYEPGPAMVRNE